VIVFEPVQRLAIRGRIGPFQATVRYLLQAADDSTRLTNQVELEPASGPLRLVAPVAVPRVRTAVAANLETLKRILEGGR
jgi:hypothetical protein